MDKKFFGSDYLRIRKYAREILKCYGVEKVVIVQKDGNTLTIDKSFPASHKVSDKIEEIERGTKDVQA